MVPYEFELSFEAGPLGLGFAVIDGCVEVETVTGQAGQLGVAENDMIMAVGDTPVSGMTKEDFVALILSMERPVPIHFSRFITAEEQAVADAAYYAA